MFVPSADPEHDVSEAFVRTFPGAEVLGALVRTPGRSLRIVGIVGDVKDVWLTTGSPPRLYAPISLAASSAVSVTARSRRPADAILEIRRAVERANPTGPSVAIEPLSRIVWRSEQRRRFFLANAGTFAVVAVLVSALGIFSAVGRVVALRARDIAVRVALGARPAEVVRLVVREGLRPVLIGTGAGLAGGVALVRVFESHSFFKTLLFSATSTDPSTYALPVIAVLATAALACLVPLKRALRVSPAATLKSE